MKFVHEIV